MSNYYIIRYYDPIIKLLAWLWSDNINHISLLANLGLEPISNPFNCNWLFTK
ncbi:hypothetical protein [Candidatus Palibaumannia cicadellinicola]|uniref:hypothetical protein n=1 Tax=Candidatus Palibaumannia cicadellinicola TaxID=186490 RepID=UPI0012E2B26C|nr:hypothetical protein [Candidatus Baumannia cicadellinicola]